ncbi:MAG: hypothetical protein R3F44_17155 [Candidatus Competibacteraceae bacterium]
MNVEAVQVNGVTVARIAVPKAASSTATTGGVYLRRRLKHDGKPECAPMLPHDITSRATRFGQLDLSAQPIPGARLEDLDPLERERLRQAAEALRRRPGAAGTGRRGAGWSAGPDVPPRHNGDRVPTRGHYCWPGSAFAPLVPSYS